MRKQIASHLRLHTHAHEMSLVLNEKVQQHTNKIKAKQNKSCPDNQLPFFIGNQIVEHGACDNGVNHTHKGNQKGSQHIQGKQKPVRLIVA